MKSKKAIGIVLACILALTSFQQILAVGYGEEYANQPKGEYKQTFTDVEESHWAFTYIAQLSKDNVIGGYPDGKFYPDNTITRAEFAKIMIGASGITPKMSTSSSFSDVLTTDWFFPYVESAKEYLTGYNVSGQTFYLPSTNAIREDIAVALVKLKGYDVSIADISLLKTMFSDYQSISSVAQPYVAVAIERGLISGYDDGTFRAQNSITRAEASAMLWRAAQYGNDNKVVTGDTPTPSIMPTVTPSVSPSATPTITPSVSPEPTEEPSSPTVSPSNTPQPTAEPTPTPIPKEYAIDTIANAKVSNWWDMTCDGENIYYYKDKSIHRISISDGNDEELINIDDFIDEQADAEDIAEEEDNFYLNYQGFYQIHYDQYENQLYVLLGFKDKNRLFVLNDEELEFVNSVDNIDRIAASLPNGSLFASASNASYYGYIVDPQSGILSEITNAYYIYNAKKNFPAAYFDRKIFFGNKESNGSFKSYSYNLTSIKEIAETYYTAFPIVNADDKSLYSIDSTGIVRYTSEGGERKGINFSEIENNDFKTLDKQNFSSKMMFSSNGDIILYDSSAQCFRMISNIK
jgi:hypothetical protein